MVTLNGLRDTTHWLDYKTKTIKDNVMSIKFNANNLAELIRSHERDAFEIERNDSIDGVLLDKLNLDFTEIKGRSIVTLGEYEYLKPKEYTNNNTGVNSCTPLTKVISQGAERNSPVLVDNYDDDSSLTSQSCIYVESTDPNLNTAKLSIDYDIKFNMTEVTFWWRFDIVKVRWNETNGVFDTIDEYPLEYTVIDGIVIAGRTAERNGIAGMNTFCSYTGNYTTTVEWNEAILFRWKFGGSNWKIKFLEEHSRSFFKINEVSFGDPSPQLSTIFVHDLIERLMYIISGKKNMFYSKYFGRVQKGYKVDGFGGLISAISGYWLRAFDPTTEKYKSLTISLQDVIDSLKAVFNVGIGIESTVISERLRIEDLKYFYQPEVIVKLPYNVSKYTTSVDPDLFFSGLTFGYEQAHDYEESNGLDEPNTETDWITPIRKSELKYTKKSPIRADEYPMELTRRMPQNLYPEEDTSRDDHVWFLDLKRTDGTGFQQREWNDDRLEEMPLGIGEPETWHSFIFTPLQMLFRHAWIFRSGLEPYLNKKIKFINSKGNRNLTMKFIGKNRYSEKDDFYVSELQRSRFLPEKVEFEHVVDDDLMNLILGTTPRMVNGEMENIPNFYFKFEWKRDGITERGYLLNLKPKGNGKFTFQKANENLI